MYILLFLKTASRSIFHLDSRIVQRYVGHSDRLYTADTLLLQFWRGCRAVGNEFSGCFGVVHIAVGSAPGNEGNVIFLQHPDQVTADASARAKNKAQVHVHVIGVRPGGSEPYPSPGTIFEIVRESFTCVSRIGTIIEPIKFFLFLDCVERMSAQ